MGMDAEKELKVTKAIITSSKLSTTSDILWIQVHNEQSAIDIQKQSATLRREARAIMYPPPEYFRTIKSVEHNCNEQKKTNKDLRYTVRIGTDNIELWTKHLQEPQYSQQPLDTYGHPIHTPYTHHTHSHTHPLHSPYTPM